VAHLRRRRRVRILGSRAQPWMPASGL